MNAKDRRQARGIAAAGFFAAAVIVSLIVLIAAEGLAYTLAIVGLLGCLFRIGWLSADESRSMLDWPLVGLLIATGAGFTLLMVGS